MSNKAMPGLVKIGYSSKHPEQRAEELEGTGLPHKFVVEYCALVEEPYKIERQIHASLERSREAKEFFSIDVEKAILEIYQSLEETSADILYEEGSMESRESAREGVIRADSEAFVRTYSTISEKSKYGAAVRAYAFKGYLTSDDVWQLDRASKNYNLSDAEKRQVEKEIIEVNANKKKNIVSRNVDERKIDTAEFLIKERSRLNKLKHCAIKEYARITGKSDAEVTAEIRSGRLGLYKRSNSPEELGVRKK